MPSQAATLRALPCRVPKSLGWPYPFRVRTWPDLDEWYGRLAEENWKVTHLLALVRSVRAVGAEDDLIAFTSLFDLMVRPAPAPEPPYDLVAVRSPVSIARVPDGTVVIEHLTLTGHDDRIERPVQDTVPCSGGS